MSVVNFVMKARFGGLYVEMKVADWPGSLECREPSVPVCSVIGSFVAFLSLSRHECAHQQCARIAANVRTSVFDTNQPPTFVTRPLS